MTRRTGLHSLVGRWLASAPPPAALEITARRVTAVAITTHRGGHALAGYANAIVKTGAVEPALNAPNLHDAPALSMAIGTALDQLSPRPRRIALVLPDTVAKVSLVRFEKVPPRQQDLDQLIRWQVRKAAPFRVEDAQVSWAPGLPIAGGGREFLVTVARRDIIESYENACAAAGAYAGIVDLASFNLINLVRAGHAPGARTGDWLLLNVAADYATIAVVRDADVISFRNRTTVEEGDLADLVHQTAMYHEDRLGGGGFSRIVLAGSSSRGPEHMERLRRQVEDRTATRAEPIALGSALAVRDRILIGPELVDAIAPAAGLLLRERLAASAERVA